MLSIGERAPDFHVPGDDGELVALSAFLGSKVVLYFYPKDNTPGCIIEAKGFRDRIADFNAVNTVVLGVSKDSLKSHCHFKTKYALPFTLLADTDTTVCQAYGVWVDKQMFGKKYKGIERATFVIDEQGMITQIWHRVKVKGHVDEVLSRLNPDIHSD
jgi:peroxiredoxin Q/BCP